MVSTKKVRQPEKKILELSVEEYLCKRCKDVGGEALKMNAGWYVGILDRLVMIPGLMALVELKRPKGGKIRVAQSLWTKRLTALGLPWYVICTHEDVDRLIQGKLDVGYVSKGARTRKAVPG